MPWSLLSLSRTRFAARAAHPRVVQASPAIPAIEPPKFLSRATTLCHGEPLPLLGAMFSHLAQRRPIRRRGILIYGPSRSIRSCGDGLGHARIAHLAAPWKKAGAGVLLARRKRTRVRSHLTHATRTRLRAQGPWACGRAGDERRGVGRENGGGM